VVPRPRLPRSLLPAPAALATSSVATAAGPLRSLWRAAAFQLSPSSSPLTSLVPPSRRFSTSVPATSGKAPQHISSDEFNRLMMKAELDKVPAGSSVGTALPSLR
jgi:hypothetical protein